MSGIDPAISGLCALSLTLIFGASGLIKLRDIETFEGSVANYQLAPIWLEKPLAYLLPIAECGSAAGLLLTSTRALAASMLLVLLTMFSVAIAINLARGRTNIDCGCFGPALRQELSGWLLIRNIFLMVLAMIVIFPTTSRPIESLDIVTMLLGALTLVTLYGSANFAIGNAPKIRALETM